MILYLAVLAIQVMLVVDVIRHGRNQLWIMALMFLPGPSTIAYLIIEVYPRLRGNRHVRTAQAKAAAKLDPEREIRAARDALDLADTVANRERLADALVARGRFREALPLYLEVRERGSTDTRSGEKLARAQFETGDVASALTTIEALPPFSSIGDRDRLTLLRARVLESLGRRGEAIRLLEDVVTRLPGEEARCRYAALLLETGDTQRARSMLEEVEARMRRLDRQQRSADADMYRWATDRLRELRAG